MKKIMSLFGFVALLGTALPANAAAYLWSAKPVAWTTGNALSGYVTTIPSTESVIYDVASDTVGTLIIEGQFYCMDPAGYGSSSPVSLLNVESIMVMGSGALFECGVAAKPFTGTFTVQFRESSDCVNNPNGSGYTNGDPATRRTDCQGLQVMGGGSLSLIGNFGSNTWTKIVGPTSVGATIQVLDATGWKVGDNIAIASSEVDGKTEQRLVGADASLIQRRSIQGITGNLITLGTENYPSISQALSLAIRGDVTIDPTPLTYVNPYQQTDLKDKYGNDLVDQMGNRLYDRLQQKQTNYKGTGLGSLVLDERTEVVNTSRNIKIIGQTIYVQDAYTTGTGDIDPTMPRGVHMMFMDVFPGKINIDGIEVRNGGRMGELARYPIHWHLSGDREGDFVRNSSIVDSSSRCITVHGTNYVQLEKNVCVNHFGHGYFLEDGDEHGNRFIDNIAILGKPVVAPANAGPSNNKALLQSDFATSAIRFVSPASFWISNPDNIFIGNSASSSGTGFWFALKDDSHKDLDMVDGIAPLQTLPKIASTGAPFTSYTPLTGYVFTGNSAHTVAVGVSLDGGPNGNCMNNPRNPCTGDPLGHVGDYDTVQSFPSWTPPSWASPIYPGWNESATAHRVIADDFTGYKATSFGMWMGAFNGAQIKNCVTADSRVNMGIVHSEDVSNSLLVGISPMLTDAEFSQLFSYAMLTDFGNTTPIDTPYNDASFFTPSGFLLYDGPTTFQNIHFLNYSGSKTVSGNIPELNMPYGKAFNGITKSPTPFMLFPSAALRSPTHQSSGLVFENSTNPRIDFTYSLGHWNQANWSAMLYDSDGSLTGTAGTTVVPYDANDHIAACSTPAMPSYLANAVACSGKYGLIQVTGMPYPNGYQFNLIRTARDNPSSPVTYSLDDNQNAYFHLGTPTQMFQFAFPTKTDNYFYQISLLPTSLVAGSRSFKINVEFLDQGDTSPEIKISPPTPTTVCHLREPFNTNIVTSHWISSGVLSLRLKANTPIANMGPGVRNGINGFYQSTPNYSDNTSGVTIDCVPNNILWYDPSGNPMGNVNIWDMEGGVKKDTRWIGYWPDASNQPVLTGDFNSDGEPDILWWNSANGDVNIWSVDKWTMKPNVNTNVYGWNPFGDDWDPINGAVDWHYVDWRDIVGGWDTSNKPVAVGDFNGDNTPDILWWNSTTGAVNTWLMVGGKKAGSLSAGSWTDVNNRPVAAGDFNGDGTSDVLWWNSVTGDVSIWDMQNGVQMNTTRFLDNQDILAIRPVGVGDFNGDGTLDILFYNSSSGYVTVWDMKHDGTRTTNPMRVIGVQTNLYNVIEATKDINGDGVADILWRDITTGSVTSWIINSNGGLQVPPLYIGTAPTTQSIIIGGRDQIIIFGTNPGPKTFGDTPFSVSATTSSASTISFSSLTSSVCTVTTGGTVTIVTAGTCRVAANAVADSYYNAAQMTQDIVINKASASVALGSLTQTYTGSALTPTATTTPNGLAVTWTNAPQTNAGTYAVTATINNANYQGSASSPGFVINKATATVALSNLTQTFTGSALTPTATTTPNGLAVTWTNAPQTNAGTYAVTATVNDVNYQGSASSPSFVISKATATVALSNLTQAYTGSALTPTATTTPNGLAVTWTNAPQTNVGTYSVTATVNNANYQGSASSPSFVISKASQLITPTAPVSAAGNATVAVTPTTTGTTTVTNITWVGSGGCSGGGSRVVNPTNTGAITNTVKMAATPTSACVVSYTRVTDANYLVATASSTTKVTAANITPTAPASATAGAVVAVTPTTTNTATTTSITWVGSGGCSGSGSRVVNSTNTGAITNNVTVAASPAAACVVTYNRAADAVYDTAPVATSATKVSQVIVPSAPASVAPSTLIAIAPTTVATQTTTSITWTVSGGCTGSGNRVVNSTNTGAITNTVTMNVVPTAVCTVTYARVADASFTAAPTSPAATSTVKATQTITPTAPATAAAGATVAVTPTTTGTGVFTNNITWVGSGGCTGSGNRVVNTTNTGTITNAVKMTNPKTGACTVTYNRLANTVYDAAPTVASTTN